MLQRLAVLSEEPQVVEAEVGLVQRRDLQRHRTRLASGCGSLPFRVQHDEGFRAGDEVEPVPAAVAEGRQGQIEEVLRDSFNPAGVHTLE
ncbi:hypothetical protein D9M72_556440 [compost metagenome]